MDKRDFYRELMDSYTFDKEKIYNNAKLGRLSGKSKLRSMQKPVYIGMTAAAAALVVTVGTVAAVNLGGRGALPFQAGESVGALSSEYRVNESSSTVSGSSDSENKNSNGNSGVTPSSYEPQLPIVPESSESTADSSTSGSIDSTGNSEPVSGVSSVPPETSEPSGGSSNIVDPPTVSSYQITNRINEVDAGAENVYTNIDIHSVDIPAEIALKLPEGVTLPGKTEKFSYSTENIGALRAYFLNDNVFYVRTQNDIRLYTMADGEAKLTASLPCAEAKVFWIGENGGRLLALVNGNAMCEVSADNGTIREVSLADAAGSGEIVEIAYNAENDILALNVFENGVYSLKTYEGGYEADKLKTLYTSADNFALIGAELGMVYFGAYGENGLQIYGASENEEPVVISSIPGEYDITVNAAFTYALLRNAQMTIVYSPSSMNVITHQNEAAIDFGISSDSFLSNGIYYKINGSEILPNDSISVISKIDFKNSLSQLYTAIPENGAVRVAEGSYTERAKGPHLVFESPVENASADIRGALDAAISLQNALARGIHGDCGITDVDKLYQTATALFTENTAAELTARCIISEADSVRITGGELVDIDLSATVLTVSEEIDGVVSGTLYINAGSFGGRSAYYTYPVKLLRGDGGYRADCIIN